MKNYMGVVSDKLTARLGHRAHDRILTGAMGTVMAETRLPALNIIDAIWVNPHPERGPSTGYGEAVRLNTIAAVLSEETDAIEDIYEPYLLQQGFLKRTPRGRFATQRAYDHLGLEMPHGDVSNSR